MIREGLAWALTFALLGLIFLRLALLRSAGYYIPLAFFLLLAVFTLYFFRNPRIDVSYRDRTVYSPADGRIFEIEEKEGRKVVKIFMNVFNNHVQRAPLAGEITEISYRKGKFLPADSREAELLNENNTVTIRNIDLGEVQVRQIAGILARRIACWVKKGDQLKPGEIFGMIKLGSQVDLFLPEKAELRVKEGDRVNTGQTVIAVWE
ncbi:MAG TPA: phosphatidylserine decarboxylase [bacterium]|nr:phosphatidylserine decarboxylase [bacterium]